MDTKTWTVVQFIDDLTVEAIPSTWIQGNDCHWPPFSREKLYNAIRKSEPLNTCWPMHKIKIFRSATYGDYLKARNKARVAESASDINAEPDIENRAQKNLMQQYHILRGITSDILQEVRSMKESLNRVEPTPGDAATTSFFKILAFQFPINLEEDLTMFNQFLEEEENFKNAVTELSRMGGSTTYSYVSRILQLILTNELALNYIWLGRKGKNVLKL
ncbi:hypothetical protein FQA39_LY03711 [Lamprigera yunnana]|nr:hypothetical protein FQA39_LY03711 [Lamprigera yunnana]